MKTGFTCGSGFNLIGAAHQNGKHLIGVVMGGMTSKERYQLMIQKMDASFASLDGTDPVRNINTMSTSSAGSPPYQLDCGNGAATHPIPTTNRVNYRPKIKNTGRIKTSIRNINKIQPKTVNRTKIIVKSTNKNKLLPKKGIIQAKTKSTIKQTVKSQNFHKPKTNIKTVSKTQNTQKVALH
jgi:D-alanyl-D-alanine carboxypeptidase